MERTILKKQSKKWVFFNWLLLGLIVFAGLGYATTLSESTSSFSGNVNFNVNKILNLTTNTPSGGITKSIRLGMTTPFDRPWIAWYDESNRLRTALGYHTTDFNSGDNHTAYEIKTSDDPLGATPDNMITRFSLGTDNPLVQATFGAIEQLSIRNDTANKFRFNATSGVFLVGDGSNVANRIDISGGRTLFGYSGSQTVLQGGQDKGIILVTNASSFGDTNKIKLYISSSGAISIGNGFTEPTAKLQVNGTMQLGDGIRQVNITLTSPNGNEWNCGVNNSGAFSCS